VGPQMSRGSVPTVEQARMLADCYRSCLQAGEELPVPGSGRKVRAERIERIWVKVGSDHGS